jgi:hypothetical protein
MRVGSVMPENSKLKTIASAEPSSRFNGSALMHPCDPPSLMSRAVSCCPRPAGGDFGAFNGFGGLLVSAPAPAGDRAATALSASTPLCGRRVPAARTAGVFGAPPALEKEFACYPSLGLQLMPLRKICSLMLKPVDTPAAVTCCLSSF